MFHRHFKTFALLILIFEEFKNRKPAEVLPVATRATECQRTVTGMLF